VLQGKRQAGPWLHVRLETRTAEGHNEVYVENCTMLTVEMDARNLSKHT